MKNVRKILLMIAEYNPSIHILNVAIVGYSYMFQSLKVTVIRICTRNTQNKLFYTYLVRYT